MRFQECRSIDQQRNNAGRGTLARIKGYVLNPGFLTISLYRQARWWREQRWNFICDLFWRFNIQQSGCFLHYDAKIGAGLMLPHPVGVVIGQGAVVGENVTIYQSVTIGMNKGGYPTIGDGVIIFPNSVVIGPIRVGDGATVGAGSVVLTDVEPGTVVAGNPARVVGNSKQAS